MNNPIFLMILISICASQFWLHRLIDAQLLDMTTKQEYFMENLESVVARSQEESAAKQRGVVNLIAKTIDGESLTLNSSISKASKVFVTKGEKPFQMKVLLYITTHFSEDLIDYFHNCWHKVLKLSPLMRNSHILVYATPSDENVTHHQVFLQELFCDNPSFRMIQRPNPGKQQGATDALSVAATNGWWVGYDWVIRLNPDVLVLDDRFFLKNMRDRAVRGIFNDCWDAPCPRGLACKERLIHTDFVIFRPTVLHPRAFPARDMSPKPQAHETQRSPCQQAESQFSRSSRHQGLQIHCTKGI